MNESERLQRYIRDKDDELDATFAKRIAELLNHPKIDEYCMVDAFYYDYSGIPEEIQEKYDFYRDMYLIFGITTEGEIVSGWVDRYDLDSDDPIVNGEIIKTPDNGESVKLSLPPQSTKEFSPLLLSTPTPDFIKTFSEKMPCNSGKTMKFKRPTKVEIVQGILDYIQFLESKISDKYYELEKIKNEN